MPPVNLGTRLAACFLTLAVAAGSARAQTKAPIRIGVLTDMTGMFSDISGPGAVAAVRMAVEDFGGEVLGRSLEVIAGDHQNKADIAANLARQWADREGVSMVNDLMNSAVALSVMEIAKEKNIVAIVNGATTSAITNERCTSNSVHYNWDTYAMAHGPAAAMMARGAKSWFFVAADYAFGRQLVDDTSRVITADGGKVAGALYTPADTGDMSSYMVQAQASGAQVIALAEGGSDLDNAIKTAAEFGITRGGTQQVLALGLTIANTHALGLEIAQGLLLTEGWYWDKDDASRAWAQRFRLRMGGKMPTATQAADYSSTLHYLQSVAAAGTTEGRAVMEQMRRLPVEDFFASSGHVLPNGLMAHDMYLMQVKTPAEARGPWDYYKLLATIPADKAFRPVADSTCPLLPRP